MKYLLAVLLAFIPCLSFASSTPDEVIVGAAANSWTQGGLRVTESTFDLAIQGSGFFILEGQESGDRFYARYGGCAIDVAGFLVSNIDGKYLLGVENGELKKINLSSKAWYKDGLVKAFRTDLNGRIHAFYSSGHSIHVATVALALFNNPKRLQRISKHQFIATQESGKAWPGISHVENRGSIYAATIEEIDFYYKNFQILKR